MKKLEERNFLKAEGTFYTFARNGSILGEKLAEQLCMPDPPNSNTGLALLREVHEMYGDNLIFAMSERPGATDMVAATFEGEDGEPHSFDVSASTSVQIVMMTKDRSPFGKHAADLCEIAEGILRDFATEAVATVLELTIDGETNIVDVKNNAFAECEETPAERAERKAEE